MLNLGSEAKFAGEIKSETIGATINVVTDVGGHTIPEGFRFHRGDTCCWYYTYAPNLSTTPVLNGQKFTSLAGGTTYKYVSASEGSVSISGWVQQ